MRFPWLLSALVAAILLWNQGWLMPAGERHITQLGRQMQNGIFGYDLEAGQFLDLAKGVTVRFDRVDSATGELRGVFVRTGETTFIAGRGRLEFDFNGHVLIDLDDGSSINGNRVLSFANFHFDNAARSKSSTLSNAAQRKGVALAALFDSGTTADMAVACSRLLWPAFALLIPFLAVVLGKPARRTTSASGLLIGLILLVLFIRTADFVGTSQTVHPLILAGIVGLGWFGTAVLLTYGEHKSGAGFIDEAFRRFAARAATDRHRFYRSSKQ